MEKQNMIKGKAGAIVNPQTHHASSKNQIENQERMTTQARIKLH